MNKNSIELTEEQREQLEGVRSLGKAPARKLQHAQVLLKIDSGKDGPNWLDGQVREAFGVSPATIWRIRHRFLEQGMVTIPLLCPDCESEKSEWPQPCSESGFWVRSELLC